MRYINYLFASNTENNNQILWVIGYRTIRKAALANSKFCSRTVASSVNSRWYLLNYQMQEFAWAIQVTNYVRHMFTQGNRWYINGNFGNLFGKLWGQNLLGKLFTKQSVCLIEQITFIHLSCHKNGEFKHLSKKICKCVLCFLTGHSIKTYDKLTKCAEGGGGGII